MSNCDSPFKMPASVPTFYPLKDLAPKTAPVNFVQLFAWLSEGGKHLKWDGKLYVASTILWDSKAKEFRQKGCSPNYQAGWWSLACCKHDMRIARPFRQNAKDQAVPTYVFTLAEKHPNVGQPLVSIARMTVHCFETMEQYACFLLNSTDAELISSRLTRQFQDDEFRGWCFGDCHADKNGKIGEPHPSHVHNRGTDWWRKDRNGKHLILVSNDFLLWKKPVFVAAATQKQSRYGKDITSDTLDKLLHLGASI